MAVGAPGSSHARLPPELPGLRSQDWSLSLSHGSPACSGGPKASLVSCLTAPTEGGFPLAGVIYIQNLMVFCQIELQQILPETV